jgi:DNA-binding SARP family transcriptional activator
VVRLAMLGPLVVRSGGGRPIEVRGTRLRALLVRLALDPGRAVGVDALVDGLWGGSPPAGAVNALQSLVSRLRRALDDGAAEEPVASEAAGYRLDLDGDQIDAHRFERLAMRGRAALAAGEPERAGTLLQEALALWRGPALVDVLEAPFAAAPAARLEELRAGAVEDRLSSDLALGRHTEAVAELEALVAAHPLRERLRAQQMRAPWTCWPRCWPAVSSPPTWAATRPPATATSVPRWPPSRRSATAGAPRSRPAGSPRRGACAATTRAR